MWNEFPINKDCINYLVYLEGCVIYKLPERGKLFDCGEIQGGLLQPQILKGEIITQNIYVSSFIIL